MSETNNSPIITTATTIPSRYFVDHIRESLGENRALCCIPETNRRVKNRLPSHRTLNLIKKLFIAWTQHSFAGRATRLMRDDAWPYGRVVFQLIRFANYLEKIWVGLFSDLGLGLLGLVAGSGSNWVEGWGVGSGCWLLGHWAGDGLIKLDENQNRLIKALQTDW